MNKKIIILMVAVGLIAVAAIIMFNQADKTSKTGNVVSNIQNNKSDDIVPAAPESGVNNTQDGDNADVVPAESKDNGAAVKEFIMTSFYEIVDGQPKPQYSLKEITVNQGERVRIKITVTKGSHDFKIDEYGVYADTQLNQEAVVEFTADKAGEFIYYCTKPGHRANGQWGTLKVLAQ